MEVSGPAGEAWNLTIGPRRAPRHSWELWQQFVRECYLRLLITIHLVITTEEAADVLTKALPKDDYRFKKFRDILMNITD